MMRKTSLILIGAAAGAAMTLVAIQPRVVLLGSTASRPPGSISTDADPAARMPRRKSAGPICAR